MNAAQEVVRSVVVLSVGKATGLVDDKDEARERIRRLTVWRRRR